MSAAVSLSVLDDGPRRADLERRREIKFVFRRRDVATLRRVLLRSCRRIAYAGPVSTVRSIYFDDPTMRACWANLAGVGIRQKTRLRWYDDEQPTGYFFFERKWRRHQITGKNRLKIACEAPAEVAFDEIHRSLCRTLPPDLAVHWSRASQSVVLVEYRREHFALRDGRARLTLDYDMRFYPQLGRRRLTRQFAQRLPGVVLIECKTAVDEAAQLGGALASLRARPSRFSKYVAACLALGYIHPH